MYNLNTEIVIDAPAHTVWAVLDDLDQYPEWNPLVVELAGTTIVGETVTGRMLLQNGAEVPLSPVLTRIVPARELRWLTTVEGDEGFTAEHFFLLTPLPGSRTHVAHNENFDGPGAAALWPLFDTVGRQSYEAFNTALKARAEALLSDAGEIHSALVELANRQPDAEIVLRCHCADNPVEVRLDQPVHHNHLCGCSRCWRPAGALMAQIAVVAGDSVQVLSGDGQLTLVDPDAKIGRHACTRCGVHMVGRVTDERHHFYGLAFVHPELDVSGRQYGIEFAGFIPSLIEQGLTSSRTDAVRKALADAAIPAFDNFSPEIMDLIAWHNMKVAASSGRLTV